MALCIRIYGAKICQSTRRGKEPWSVLVYMEQFNLLEICLGAIVFGIDVMLLGYA